MKTILALVTLAIVSLAVALAIPACTKQPACLGYERVDVGSGCRKLSSGEFVDRAHCEECGA